jgi:hypothetical protein
LRTIMRRMWNECELSVCLSVAGWSTTAIGWKVPLSIERDLKNEHSRSSHVRPVCGPCRFDWYKDASWNIGR